MLTLTVKDGDILTVGNVTLVARYKFGRRMQLSFEAPREVRIQRMQVGKSGVASATESLTLRPTAEAAHLKRTAQSWGITGEMREHVLNDGDD